MSITHEETAGAISELAFQLALLSESETVKAIGEAHAALVDQYLKIDSAAGANLRARQLIESALMERDKWHGMTSTAIH
jgi:hypothetical protein